MCLGLKPQHFASLAGPWVPLADRLTETQGREIRGSWTLPGSLKLLPQGLPNYRVLQAVVVGPENTQLLVLLNQAQDGAEALGQAEIGVPAALLPGEDGEQLQGVDGGQRAPPGLL